MEPHDDPHDVFTGLWVDHSSAVRAFAFRRCPSTMVDDVVAETFVVAWRHLDEVPAQARAWLLGCARRVIHTQLRSRDRYLALERRVASSPDETVMGADEQVITLSAMTQAWEQLSQDDREVLALSAWDGLDSKQSALVLGCSPLALRARLSRARRRLNARLTEADADEVAPHPRKQPMSATAGKGETRCATTML